MRQRGNARAPRRCDPHEPYPHLPRIPSPRRRREGGPRAITVLFNTTRAHAPDPPSKRVSIHHHAYRHALRVHVHVYLHSADAQPPVPVLAFALDRKNGRQNQDSRVNCARGYTIRQACTCVCCHRSNYVPVRFRIPKIPKDWWLRRPACAGRSPPVHVDGGELFMCASCSYASTVAAAPRRMF